MGFNFATSRPSALTTHSRQCVPSFSQFRVGSCEKLFACSCKKDRESRHRTPHPFSRTFTGCQPNSGSTSNFSHNLFPASTELLLATRTHPTLPALCGHHCSRVSPAIQAFTIIPIIPANIVLLRLLRQIHGSCPLGDPQLLKADSSSVAFQRLLEKKQTVPCVLNDNTNSYLYSAYL